MRNYRQTFRVGNIILSLKNSVRVVFLWFPNNYFLCHQNLISFNFYAFFEFFFNQGGKIPLPWVLMCSSTDLRRTSLIGIRQKSILIHSAVMPSSNIHAIIGDGLSFLLLRMSAAYVFGLRKKKHPARILTKDVSSCSFALLCGRPVIFRCHSVI